MCSEILRRIDSALFGSCLTLQKANKLVQKKIEECEIDQFENDERLNLSKQDLDVMLTLSIQRLERVENKAMGTLLGIAVAIAVFGATSGLLGDDGLFVGHGLIFKDVAAVGLVLAMLYLFGSGILSLGSYKIGQIYYPMLSDRAPVVSPSMEAKVIVYSIEQNQRVAMLRSNSLSASFACLRNGLLVVLMLGMFMVFVAGFAVEQSGCPTTVSTR
ncbi:MAG: hypothetical protein H6750_13290 [Nitrospiraceae bacterium]|nr:hypothetical protein [Nitrospira sp.]MCA9457626.1 hypothetical protein [Nitrospira sp.]MCB9775278.1 hypothetical protein [Nitrospiraceae bacterium]